MTYIKTGEVPAEAAAPGTTGATTTPPSGPGAGTTGGAGGGTTTTPSGGGASGGSVGKRLDEVLRRQRELVDEIKRLRDDVGKGG